MLKDTWKITSSNKYNKNVTEFRATFSGSDVRGIPRKYYYQNPKNTGVISHFANLLVIIDSEGNIQLSSNGTVVTTLEELMGLLLMLESMKEALSK